VAEAAVAEYRPRADISIIAAFVVRGEGTMTGAETIIDCAGARLAAYKRPKQIFFVDALPRSANGKLLRRRLAELIPVTINA
jgi:acyl-coenzyme A synthetase/AMP-(fatty) acid ligase